MTTAGAKHASVRTAVKQIETVTSYTPAMEHLAAECPHATFYHSRAWVESLAETYPHMAFRCLVRGTEDSLSGFLPYFLIPRGPVLTAWSMPFGSYGGPVATNEHCADALRRAYTSIAARRVIAASCVDLSNATSWPDCERRAATTHLIDLSRGFESLWTETIDKQRQKRSRRAQRLGVSVRRGNSNDDLKRFHEIYCERMEAFGENTRHPLALFKALLERGGESVRLFVAEHDGAIVGGHFNFYWKNTVTAWTGMTTPESDQSQPGTLLYIECMRAACDEGFTTYNLGESLGKPSLIAFKESLGGVAHDYTVVRRQSWLGTLAGALR